MKMLPPNITQPVKERKPLGYYIGLIFGYIIAGCLAAIAVACTIRICSWILPF